MDGKKCCGHLHQRIETLVDSTVFNAGSIEIVSDILRRSVDLFYRVFPDMVGILDSLVVPTGTLTGRWTFAEDTKIYRSPARRQIGVRTRDRIINRFIRAVSNELSGITRRLIDNDITINRWYDEVRDVITDAHIGGFMFGRGGINAVTDIDRGLLREYVADQTLYLANFANEILANPDWSERRIINRTRLYSEAVTSAYERGKVASYGITLPEYPADGNQICKSRCRCRWHIVEKPGGVLLCYWLLNIAAVHCESCRQNTAKWAPYRVQRPMPADNTEIENNIEI